MNRLAQCVCVALLLAALDRPTQATCHTVVPTCANNGDGSNWTCAGSPGGPGSFKNIPGTLVRGDIYYLADGSYGRYKFNTAVSGTTTVELRKAQTYDHCTAIGWNSARMGSAQAVFATHIQLDIATSYLTVNGNGTQTTQGCGFGPGANYAASPQSPSDCGIKIDNTSCTGGADACDRPITVEANAGGYTIEYVELVGQGSNTIDTGEISALNPLGPAATFTHLYWHNAGCVYFAFVGPRTVSYSYFWGTEVNGGSTCHGQYMMQGAPVAVSNSSEHHNVYRDIQGTAVYTFLQNSGSATFDNWSFYDNIYWNSNGSSQVLANGIVACINTGVVCTNLRFYQNTIVNTFYATGLLMCDVAAGCSATVKNNLWYQTFNTDGVTPACPTFGGNTTNVQDHNSFLKCGASCPLGTANVCDNSSLNPFTNWTGGVLTLASDAAGWNNRAERLGSPYDTDATGNAFTTDRGAYQWVPGIGATLGGGQRPRRLDSAAGAIKSICNFVRRFNPDPE